MKYDPVAAALRRRQVAGVCLYCGGPLSESKVLVAANRGERVCLNEKCGRGRGRKVKLQSR